MVSAGVSALLSPIGSSSLERLDIARIPVRVHISRYVEAARICGERGLRSLVRG